MAKRPELEIVNGPLTGKKFSVPKGGLRLGRSSSNDIHIPDEELSRNHCLFEAVGEAGVRVTDLASANGTILNGALLGNDPADLKPGDEILVGATKLRVLGDVPVVPRVVDLGLGGEAPKASSPAAGETSRRRSPFANVLWIVALAAVAAAAYVVLQSPLKKPVDSLRAVSDNANPTVKEVYYEKVEADSSSIFRYAVRLSADGVLNVEVDNVPDEKRHVSKSQRLDEKALAELNDILAFEKLRSIDREYVGVTSEPPELDSWALKVVYSNRVRSMKVVNTQEPDAFREIREKLETFSKNQLGVWALQYSREKLVALAVESVALGTAKWSDREVQYGNLYGAVKAFEEALFYLETVNPKPDCATEARQGLELAKKELDRRCREQSFLADRAINLQQWDVAQRELATLLELIPNRSDDRNRAAAAKLVDVERRMKGDK